MTALAPEGGRGSQDKRTTALGLSFKDLERLVDAGPLGYVRVDDGDVIESVNETLTSWLGYDRADLVGKTTFQDLLAVGDRIYYDTHLRPLLHLQQFVSEIAMSVVCVDGSRVPVLVNAVRLGRDGDGFGVEYVLIDATTRRNYEIELLRERKSAEQASERLRVQFDVVSGLSTARTLAEIVAAVTERGTHAKTGAQCSVWMFEAGDRATRMGEFEPEEVPSELQIPPDAPGLAELRAGELIVVADKSVDAQEISRRYPLISLWLEQTDLRSVAVAPLIIDRQLLGVLAYGFDSDHVFDAAEERVVESLANQTVQAIRRAWLLEAERRSGERLESLFRLTTALSGAVGMQAVIDVLVATGVDHLGAVSTRIALIDGNASTVRMYRGSGDVYDTETVLPIDARSIGCVSIRERRIVVAEDFDQLVADFPDSLILNDDPPGRVIAAPLRRGEEVFGAWVLSFVEAGEPNADDLTVIQLAVEQASSAVRRAASHEEEVVARQQYELRHTIAEALNRAINTADVASAMVSEGRKAFGADAIAVLSVDAKEPGRFGVDAEAGLSAVVTPGVALDREMEAVGRAVRTVSPVFVTGRFSVQNAFGNAFDTDRWEAAAVLPLVHSGTVLGLIVALYDRASSLTTPVRLALSGVAAEASLVVGRTRQHEVDRLVGVTLQAAMLPDALSVPDGWSIDAFYEAGTEDMLVGGDLFDVTSFDDGSVSVMVGDVVGHGLSAAASMGQLRSAAKALGLLRMRPSSVLDGLDEFAQLTPGARYASICVANFRADGTGRIAAAGHPFPVLVSASGEVTVVEDGRSPLLAITHEGLRTDAELDLEIGDSLVLYTDGLIERRGESIDDGLLRLALTLSAIDFSVEGPAERIVHAMTTARATDDDIVVLCLTRSD